jgi:hypothetical protein
MKMQYSQYYLNNLSIDKKGFFFNSKYNFEWIILVRQSMLMFAILKLCSIRISLIHSGKKMTLSDIRISNIVNYF